MKKSIKLDNRLKEIVKILGKNEIVVDVGCDHGYVANYLIEEDLAKLVYATDISKPSLEKNIEFSKLRGNENKVISILGNGLFPVKDKNFDAVIMAGMGGELIMKIIDDAFDFIQKKTIILQPMTARVELRKYLGEKGFKIEKESIIRDGNKFYEIIRAVPGEKIESTSFYYFGNNLVEECNETLIEYVEFLLEKNRVYLEQANKSNTEKSMLQRQKLTKEIEIFKEVLNECKS
ncbi:MAG: class I SAM-dependent methyltransferase [Neofamilia sp.]